MDVFGNILHYGAYITGDDGVLYSNDSYNEYSCRRYQCGSYPNYNYGKYYNGTYKPNNNQVAKKETKVIGKGIDDYDDWYNSEEFWNQRSVTPF